MSRCCFMDYLGKVVKWIVWCYHFYLYFFMYLYLSLYCSCVWTIQAENAEVDAWFNTNSNPRALTSDAQVTATSMTDFWWCSNILTFQHFNILSFLLSKFDPPTFKVWPSSPNVKILQSVCTYIWRLDHGPNSELLSKVCQIFCLVAMINFNKKSLEWF